MLTLGFLLEYHPPQKKYIYIYIIIIIIIIIIITITIIIIIISIDSSSGLLNSPRRELLEALVWV